MYVDVEIFTKLCNNHQHIYLLRLVIAFRNLNAMQKFIFATVTACHMPHCPMLTSAARSYAIDYRFWWASPVLYALYIVDCLCALELLGCCFVVTSIPLLLDYFTTTTSLF